MECAITAICDHKLVRKHGDCTEVRYIKDQGWTSVSSFHAYNSYKEAACVPTVRRIAAILQRSAHWFRCDDHYSLEGRALHRPGARRSRQAPSRRGPSGGLPPRA